MKKIYTLALALVFAFSLNAQRGSTQQSAKKITNPKLNAQSTIRFRSQLSGDRASYWLNYALQSDDPTGPTAGLADFNFLLIFPDSEIIAGQFTTGETAYPQFIKAATMLDPKNMPIQGISAASPYTLDSIGIAYAYLRNTPPTVIDTLVVQIFKHDVSLEYTTQSTYTYQDITYTYTNNDITPSQVLATYTYLLDENDSSNFASEIFFNTSNVPSQAAGNRIGVVVSYKPGYTYSITDSIDLKNSFYVFSSEQNGLGTDPTYFGITGMGTSDLNTSYTLSTDVRYNINTLGWNGYFLPTWAWNTDYAAENHIIEFKVSEVVGIQEASLGLASNAFPNPANGQIFVDYSLQKSADITIEITDLAGRLVLADRQGDRSQGQYRVQLNTSELPEGTYFVNVRTEAGAVTTSKIVVTH